MNLQPSTDLRTGYQIAEFKKNIKEQILSGEMNPLEGLGLLRSAGKAISDLSSDEEIIEKAIKEFDTHGEKELNLNRVKIEKIETGIRYDYTVCNDPEWNTLNLQKAEIESKLKARESILKVVRQPVVNNETGEITVPYIPALKTSKTNLKFTVK